MRQINNAGVFGIQGVGLPSEDIPEGSLSKNLANRFPGRLIRIYIPKIPSGTSANEDGSYTGAAPKWWYEFVDGVRVGIAGITGNNSSISASIGQVIGSAISSVIN